MNANNSESGGRRSRGAAPDNDSPAGGRRSCGAESKTDTTTNTVSGTAGASPSHGAAPDDDSRMGGRRSRGAEAKVVSGSAGVSPSHGTAPDDDSRTGGRRSCGGEAKTDTTTNAVSGSAGASPSHGTAPGDVSRTGGRRSRGAEAKVVSGSAGASPSRKHPVHGVLAQPNQPTIVSVTVCTKDRKPWLANDEVHRLLFRVWKAADLWRVGRYVIMPDHIHLFTGEFGDIPLDNWVRYWKSQFTKLHGNKGHRWQTDHWDRRVRNAAEYEDAWNYIYWNPVRANLVQEPDQWPYKGVVHDLRWD